MKALIGELGAQVGIKAACEALKVARSSYYRRPKVRIHRPHPRGLSPETRVEVRSLLNSERFQDLAPRQVYARLLDEDVYHCHWRTMYRILHEHQEVRERRAQRQRPTYHKPELLATAPNQVWSWDITRLRGANKWTNFALYTLMDIYSRYVVGWLIADTECAEHAQELIAQSCQRHAIQPNQLIIHNDNGAPMKAKTLAQLLADLQVGQSFSRPHTSNDNPFSEAQFRTLKYHRSYPTTIPDIETARTWARDFFGWYNEQHYHSGLNLLTPASVHFHQATAICEQRQAVLAHAYAQHPERFPHGQPVAKLAPSAVYINPPQAVAFLP